MNDQPGSSARFTVADLYLALLILVWGANYTVIKSAFRLMTPLAFNAARFVLATVTVLLVVTWSGQNLRLSRRDRGQAVVAGLLANTLYQLLFTEGLARTTVGNGALIQATMPMQVAVISHLLKRERLPLRGWAGVLVATLGLGMLLTLRQAFQWEVRYLLGDALMLGAAFTWACYTVYVGQLLRRVAAAQVTAVGFLAGTPVLVVIALPQLLQQNWKDLPWQAWGAVAFSGVLAIGLGYFVWNYALRKLGSTRTAVYSNATPVVAAVVAWLTLGERPSLGQLAGAVLVLFGVVITRTSQTPPGSPQLSIAMSGKAESPSPP
ncbi:MAG: DMT family transporter [Thermoanaerobaculum sp.]|nr:DMT family transporter [Thermoanaerobaculum sp.]MDW7966585.1 DMT family transporter [Thermoanaerobaculum sp.]